MAIVAERQPIVSFLSDYGLQDEFVGVCHGVIARRCPRARVIDLTHGIPRQDVRAGALVLRGALPYLPAGVHLAVVDPGVGAAGPGSRRAVALRTAGEERLLVGPDNGLLSLAAAALGGAVEAVDVGRSGERLNPLSRTFHGRDLFAPVAAALADGVPLREVGEPLAVAELQMLELPSAERRNAGLLVHVLHVDAFGNLLLDASPAELAALDVALGATVRVEGGGHRRFARLVGAFADVAAGELLLYEDGLGMLALAVNLGSAAELLGVGRDEALLVEPA